jgi:hypothetical protein
MLRKTHRPSGRGLVALVLLAWTAVRAVRLVLAGLVLARRHAKRGAGGLTARQRFQLYADIESDREQRARMHHLRTAAP